MDPGKTVLDAGERGTLQLAATLFAPQPPPILRLLVHFSHGPNLPLGVSPVSTNCATECGSGRPRRPEMATILPPGPGVCYAQPPRSARGSSTTCPVLSSPGGEMRISWQADLLPNRLEARLVAPRVPALIENQVLKFIVPGARPRVPTAGAPS